MYFYYYFAAPPRARPDDNNVILTAELEADLKPEAPLANRIKAIKELTESCETKKAELVRFYVICTANWVYPLIYILFDIVQYVIEKIWTLVNDLFKTKDGQSPSKEARHLTFDLMTALVQAQMEKTGVIRAKLFVFIKGHENPEDIYKKFQLLQSLTMNGKDLEYFEERLGPLLHDWIFHKQIGNIPMIAFLGFVVVSI